MAKLLAAVAGGLIAFSMPPWGWWPLAFAGIALIERLLAGQPRRARFVRGFIVGVFWMFPATLWMWDLTPPGYIVQSLIYSVFYGVGAAAVPSGRGRRIALPAALVVVAFVRWNWPFGGVPLATLAISQSNAPLGQTARVLGSLTIVALVGVAGVGLAALADRDRRGAIAAAGVLVGALVLAAVAPDGKVVDTINVAIVQGGGPQNTRAINTSARDVFDRHVAATAGVQVPVDVVLWPEDVVHSSREMQNDEQYDIMVDLAAELDAPLIAGIIETYRDEGYFLNASIVIDPNGETTSRYDKLRRVPFGEYVPFRSIIEKVAPDFLPSRDARAGTGPAFIDTEFGRFATSISWEIFHDDRAFSGVNVGGQLLINPTNGSSFWLTQVQTQQVASSQLRAIENGRWVLQAAPTGFSAVIRSDGSIVERSAISEARVLQHEVDLRDGRTWATRLGAWPMLVIAVALFAVAHRHALLSSDLFRRRLSN